MMGMARLFLLFLACLVPIGAYAQSFGANDAPFLNMVGDLEGPRGFGDIYGAAPFFPEQPLDTMTLEEVLSYQRDLRSAGTVSSAVARYQFIHTTLSGLVERLDLDTGLVFDGEVQTYLARHMMHDCGFYERSTPTPALGDCLAKIWAALPLMTGPYAGRSAYQGIAGNNALIDPASVRTVLDARFAW